MSQVPPLAMVTTVEHTGSHTVSIRTHVWGFKRSCAIDSCNAPSVSPGSRGPTRGHGGATGTAGRRAYLTRYTWVCRRRATVHHCPTSAVPDPPATSTPDGGPGRSTASAIRASGRRTAHDGHTRPRAASASVPGPARRVVSGVRVAPCRGSGALAAARRVRRAIRQMRRVRGPHTASARGEARV